MLNFWKVMFEFFGIIKNKKTLKKTGEALEK